MAVVADQHFGQHVLAAFGQGTPPLHGFPCCADNLQESRMQENWHPAEVTRA